MAPPPVKRIQSSNEELNRIQDSFLPTINALRGCPILDGRLVETMPNSAGIEVPISLGVGAGFRRVPHKLGRKPLGWFSVAPSCDGTGASIGDVFADTAVHGDEDRFLYLATTATAVTVKLWVF